MREREGRRGASAIAAAVAADDGDALAEGGSHGSGPIRASSSSGACGAIFGDVVSAPVRPLVKPVELWFMGIICVIGVLTTGHLYFRLAVPAQPHGESWRRGCRQCRAQWWHDFWKWRLEMMNSARAGDWVPPPPADGVEWEWGNAVNDTDWFNASGELVTSVIAPHVPIGSAVLHIGCGDSPLPSLLHSAGYRPVENLDISPEVIELMRTRYPAADWPGLDFEVRDFMASPTVGGGAPPPAHRFAAVVDKAGIWDWLQDEKSSATTRLLESVRTALQLEPEPGAYIIATKQTPHELQGTLMAADANFAVDMTYPLPGGIAWAYVLVPL
eukprot:TRINITY_DN18958_c0_g2_i1.p1 TRINITY_DN18958_c0_g2~~TRINITY_DN18958_c0_g2_i1.p1  ORF type:complete len:329 (-),score=54.83 TRINITY_DN18958_c0_g2_i1:107-1093(-)